MLGPHTCYWFAVRSQTATARVAQKRRVPMIHAEPKLEALLTNDARAVLEREILPAYIQGCRWFASKARKLRQVQIVESVPISSETGAAQIWFIQTAYLDGPVETYAFPVQIAYRRCRAGHRADCARRDHRPFQRVGGIGSARRDLGFQFSNAIVSGDRPAGELERSSGSLDRKARQRAFSRRSRRDSFRRRSCARSRAIRRCCSRTNIS